MGTAGPDNVVVGVDGSETTDGAVAWAAAYAARTHSPLVLLGVVKRALWSFSSTATPGSVEGGKTHDAVEDYLASAEAAAQKAVPGIDVARKILEGKVVDQIVSESAGARLVVIGAHCTNGAADLILNDHVMGVVTGAHCPVLVWRHAPDGGKDRPVVVGVDESKSAPAALEAAFGVAEALHAPVDVAHVWETDAAVGLGYAAGPVDWDLEHAMKTEQARQLEALVAPVAARHRRVHTSVVLADGGPAKKLVELSTTARVVVVGTDHGRVSGAILGSVAQNVVHHAKCPVLVARA